MSNYWQTKPDINKRETLPKGFLMKCPHCEQVINKNNMDELYEYFSYNKEYNCQVCQDCNRDIKLNNILNG